MNKMFFHDMKLLNNTRIEHNFEKNCTYIWVYHDKNYKNGTFYCINAKGILTLCTIREGDFIEEVIAWKEISK